MYNIYAYFSFDSGYLTVATEIVNSRYLPSVLAAAYDSFSLSDGRHCNCVRAKREGFLFPLIVSISGLVPSDRTRRRNQPLRLFKGIWNQERGLNSRIIAFFVILQLLVWQQSGRE